MYVRKEPTTYDSKNEQKVTLQCIDICGKILSQATKIYLNVTLFCNMQGHYDLQTVITLFKFIFVQQNKINF